MYSFFQDVYREFEKNGFDDPLMETLHLADLLTAGGLRGRSPESLGEAGLTIEEIVHQRKGDKPLEYILGKAPFMGRNLLCAPGALIPREETELLTRTCLGYIERMLEKQSGVTVIEMGTGCGNIAVSIAMGAEKARIYASDISEEAVDVARKNVELLGVGDRVRLFCGDLFAPLEGEGLEESADLVVCNPPYIPTSSLEKLASEIIDYEPTVALDAGAYGINIFRRLISESLEYLRPGGILAFEIGAGQDKIVARLFNKSGAWEDISNFDDGENIRVFSAVKKAED